MSAAPRASAAGYEPRRHRLLTFHDAAARFRDGTDTPRAYLERCLAVIEAREGDVKAFAFLDRAGAIAAAEAASERYRRNRPLSPVDGLPLGIKDLIDTADMPTELGSALFRGRRPMCDAAIVDALRRGGAVLVGKTETVCLGSGGPPPTRNPFDISRTPGGSSSGSAAAVGAGMLPVAIGTQGRGSTIRPASFCGAFGFKPSFGAINRQGVFQATLSLDHIGLLAGSLSDAWSVAQFSAERAGGDPGHPGLAGAAAAPAPQKPARLIRLDTAGWAAADATTQAVFERYLAALSRAGITIAGRRDDPAIEAYEQALAEVPENWRNLYWYEMRWPLAQYLERHAAQVPDRLKSGIVASAALTPADYRAALIKRGALRALHGALAARCDGFLTLAAPGPAPVGMDQGSAAFNEAASMLGVPTVSLPLLTQDGLPLGVQYLGAWREDEALIARARWLDQQQSGDAP